MAIVVSGIGMIVVLDSMDSDEPLNDFGSIPDFELIERSGETVTLSDLTGEIWIANLIFTHCAGTCPMMTVQMRALGNLLPENVRLVSITVDPNRDTPEVLSEYAALHGAGARLVLPDRRKGRDLSLGPGRISSGSGRHSRNRDRNPSPTAHASYSWTSRDRFGTTTTEPTKESHDLIQQDVGTLLDRAG